jgi:hypothetical protein
MSSIVRKLVKCDRCGYTEERADPSLSFHQDGGVSRAQQIVSTTCAVAASPKSWLSAFRAA